MNNIIVRSFSIIIASFLNTMELIALFRFPFFQGSKIFLGKGEQSTHPLLVVDNQIDAFFFFFGGKDLRISRETKRMPCQWCI